MCARVVSCAPCTPCYCVRLLVVDPGNPRSTLNSSLPPTTMQHRVAYHVLRCTSYAHLPLKTRYLSDQIPRDAFGTSHSMRSLPGRVYYLHGIACLEHWHGVPTGGSSWRVGGTIEMPCINSSNPPVS